MVRRSSGSAGALLTVNGCGSRSPQRRSLTNTNCPDRKSSVRFFRGRSTTSTVVSLS